MSTSTAILIFQIGQLGDTLVALPTIQAIRDLYPGRRLVLLTAREQDPGRNPRWALVRDIGFDQVLTYDPSNGFAGRVVQLGRILRTLRAERFEAAFNLAPPRTRWQATRDNIFFRRLAGVACYHANHPDSAIIRRYQAGVRVDGAGLRLLRVVHRPADQRMLDGFRLAIPDTDRRAADRLVTEVNKDGQATLIAFAPGSRMPAKQWPESRYREAGEQLLAQVKGAILLAVGGPEESALCQRLCDAWGPVSRNLAGRLSPLGSAAILERCALYIGNDSGAMHLAAMVGTPCVAIFSARAAVGLWYPFGERHTVLREETECAGCMLTGSGARSQPPHGSSVQRMAARAKAQCRYEYCDS